MLILVAGLTAALLAWLVNRGVGGLKRFKKIIYLAPLVEEVSKTLASVFFNASIVPVHGVFGFFEALYELYYSGREGFFPGVASVAGHFLFGYVSLLVLTYTDNLALAIGGGFFAHMLWNFFVVKYLVRREKI